MHADTVVVAADGSSLSDTAVICDDRGSLGYSGGYGLFVVAPSGVTYCACRIDYVQRTTATEPAE
jgi:hypothetical protein